MSVGGPTMKSCSHDANATHALGLPSNFHDRSQFHCALQSCLVESGIIVFRFNSFDVTCTEDHGYVELSSWEVIGGLISLNSWSQLIGSVMSLSYLVFSA